MRYVRFLTSEGARYGMVEGEEVVEIQGDLFSSHQRGQQVHKLQGLKILPPCSPSKILALALNYPAHASEVGQEVPAEPQIFFKPPSAVIAHEEEIVLPSISNRVAYEGELAVIMKGPVRNLATEEAMEHVLGYTCANDVSARDFQRKDRHWWRAKGFDTFCPLGPFISTGIDPHNLRLEVYVNGRLKQSTNTGEMLFKIPQMISFITQALTLLPGDVILTGTCVGSEAVAPGDEIEVRIEQVGSLRNRCRAESQT